MTYCVLVNTELARAEYDYFEPPMFFDTREEAEAYANKRFESISEYPANVSTSVFVSLED